ncbi:hypothetical protein D3C77_233480 [compost metagenome]
MRQLVRHQRHQRAVAGDDGRGGEGQPGVLHAAEGEAGRQDQQVVTAPAIGAVERLGRVDHLRRRLQLPLGGLQLARLGPHAGARVERGEGQVAHGDGDQIGRDRVVQLEAPRLGPGARRLALGGQLFGRHDDRQVGRSDDAGAIGLPDAGAVLGRNPGAGQDRLALAEQIGLLAARRLLRAQPLQRRGVGPGRIGDDDLLRLVALEGGEAHAQRLALDRIGGAQAPFKGAALGVGDAADVQHLGVQHHLGRAGAAGHVQRRLARQGLGGEVGGQVQVDVRHPSLGWAGEGMGVVDIVGRGSRRRSGGFRRHGASSRRGSAGAQGRGEGGGEGEGGNPPDQLQGHRTLRMQMRSKRLPRARKIKPWLRRGAGGGRGTAGPSRPPAPAPGPRRPGPRSRPSSARWCRRNAGRWRSRAGRRRWSR